MVEDDRAHAEGAASRPQNGDVDLQIRRASLHNLVRMRKLLASTVGAA
jgi:hypothetical protein